MIKNIIFDVGGVLIDFRYEDYMLNDLGFSEETTEYLSIHMVNSATWAELDRGVISQEEAVNIFKENLPDYKAEIDLFWSMPEKLVTEYPYSEPLFKSLKEAGYNVYILSNYPEKMYELHWPTFDFVKKADGLVVSALEKMTKPDEKIYRLLLDRFGLKAEECVFIDDREVNVSAAKAMGIHGILFKNYEQAVKELYKLIGR